MALDFAAGCLGGCAGILVGYPLDTVKIHMQTQDCRNPRYRGTWHCLNSIVAKESVGGLYRGMSSPIAGVAVVNAIVFGVYGGTQRHLPDSEHLATHFLAGASAGIAQTPVCSPIELAKTRLQLQSRSSGSGRYSGPWGCLRQIYKQEGFRGIFHGLGITLLREAPSYGVYFLTYEILTRSSRPAEPLSTLRMLLAGGFAGTASWVVSYPLDVVKSRLQADTEKKYSGALDCYRKSVRAEGYSCLYRGLNSTIVRAFPTNAATFAVVTWTFRLFSERPLDTSKPAALARLRHEDSFTEKSKAFLDGISVHWKHFSRSHSSPNVFFDAAKLQFLNGPITADDGAVLQNDILLGEERVANDYCKMCRGDRKVDWADVEDAIVICGCKLQRVIKAPDLPTI